MSLVGGTPGGEFVLVVTDTAVNGASASAPFQITASGITAAGAVSSPSTSSAPLSNATSSNVPRLDFTFAARLNDRARRDSLLESRPLDASGAVVPFQGAVSPQRASSLRYRSEIRSR